MDILKIPLRNGSMVRYPSSSGLILLATLRIGIPRGHRVSRLLWECRLLYRYLFPFLVKHCHFAQNSKKRTHSLTCVFFCLLYTRFQRGRGTSQNPSTPRGLLWAVAVQCGHGLGFSELNTCYIYKVKQYWSPIIPGETERCRLQKTCSVPPIYCLISRLQTLFFFLFFFQRYSSYSRGEGCWGWGLFDKVIYTPLIGPVICLYTARDPINHCSSLDSPVSRWWGLLERGTLFIKSSPWRWFCPNEADVANYYVNETKFSLSGRQTWKFW